jgi:hypothetical protein
MKNLRQILWIIIFVIAIFAAFGCGQSRTTNRIYRPCPALTVPASVSVLATGDILASPCKLGSLQITPDASQTPYTNSSAQAVVSIGTQSRYTPDDKPFFYGARTNFPLTINGSSKFYIGGYTGLDVQGTATNPTIMGTWTDIFSNSSFPAGTGTVYGTFTNVDIGGQYSDVYGGFFSAISGGSGASGLGSITGVLGVVGMAHNGNTTNAFAGDFYLQSSPSSPSIVTKAAAVRARAVVRSGVTVNDMRGLSISDWEPLVGSVGTSYGIYADSTIDIGTSKYFIYSLSASPSFFTGKINFDATNTTAGTTGARTINKPTGTVNFAAGTSQLVLTNALINSNSLIFCNVRTNDATAISCRATDAGSGVATIRLNANATGETSVAFWVTN